MFRTGRPSPLVVAVGIGAALIMIALGNVLTAVTYQPFKSDPAATLELRQQFSNEPWVVYMRGARWATYSESLDIESSTSNEGSVLAMCRGLSKAVQAHYGASVGDLYIWDMHNNLLASNFMDISDKCYWRQ